MVIYLADKWQEFCEDSRKSAVKTAMNAKYNYHNTMWLVPCVSKSLDDATVFKKVQY